MNLFTFISIINIGSQCVAVCCDSQKANCGEAFVYCLETKTAMANWGNVLALLKINSPARRIFIRVSSRNILCSALSIWHQIIMPDQLVSPAPNGPNIHAYSCPLELNWNALNTGLCSNVTQRVLSCDYASNSRGLVQVLVQQTLT